MTTLSASALSPFSRINFPYGDNQRRIMGVTAASYVMRLFRQWESKLFPPFTDATDFLRHCHSIGAGGIQVSVSNWDPSHAHRLRMLAEELNMYVEGQISLPQDTADVDRFSREVNVAAQAGVGIIRTVCLSGRRYETFSSLEEFQAFSKKSYRSLELAEPIMQKARIKLAVENHKDWRADEFIRLIRHIDSAYCGVCLDTGNNYALLEEAWEFAIAMAPYTINLHVKDMNLQPHPGGFLLSEVPLGEGIVELERIFTLVEQHNPSVTYGLEMISRDPLYIPCLEESYWSTFSSEIPAADLAAILRLVAAGSHAIASDVVSSLSIESRLKVEEDNNVKSITYAKEHLGFE